MPFSSLKSTFEIIMQLNCVWMFWHSECESRGLGRLPCCTLTVMSPRAGSLRVSFIILSMLGYCKVQLPSPAVNQSPVSLCQGGARMAGLLAQPAEPPGSGGVFPADEAGASGTTHFLRSGKGGTSLSPCRTAVPCCLSADCRKGREDTDVVLGTFPCAQHRSKCLS